MKQTTQSTTSAATENLKKEKQTIEEMVPEHYLEYWRVVEEQGSQDLPPQWKYNHAIDLKEGTEPSNNCKIYPLNPEEQVTLDAFLEDMLKRGYIHPSKSPFTSPFFFVKKKDDKLCLVQDYRWLNTITIKNQYPLPLIPDVINKLKDAQIFTKFDVQWGYNNVWIKEGDKWKATVRPLCFSLYFHYLSPYHSTYIIFLLLL